MRYSMKGIFKSPDPFKEKYREMILKRKEEILHALKMRLEERINDRCRIEIIPGV